MARAAGRRWLAIALLAGGVLSAPLPAAESARLGQTRAELIEENGKPQSSLHRGEIEILMFANGVRADLRDDVVVALHEGRQATIVTRDGARYVASASGHVRRVDEPAPVSSEPPAASVAAPAASAPTAVAPPVPTAAAPSSPPPASREGPPAARGPDLASAPATTTAESDPATAAVAGATTPVFNLPPDAIPGLPGIASAFVPPSDTERYLETGGAAQLPAAPPPPPAWVGWAKAGLGFLFRFVLSFVVLRLACKWIDLPCYTPDVLKVAFLYAVLRDGIADLAHLGGYWEFIDYFRVGDIVGFLAVAVLLYRFKVALSGLTALKVAVATNAVTYGLMIGVGLVLTFGLQAFY